MNLPRGRSIVMHLVPREHLPEPPLQGKLRLMSVLVTHMFRFTKNVFQADDLSQLYDFHASIVNLMETVNLPI